MRKTIITVKVKTEKNVGSISRVVREPNALAQVASCLATATGENFLPGIMSWNVKTSFVALLLKEDKRSNQGAFFCIITWNPLSSSECCLCCLEKHSRFGWATREALRKDRFSITPYVWRRRDFSGWQRWSQDGKDKKKEALARWLQIKQKESLFREYNQMRHHCRALNSF